MNRHTEECNDARSHDGTICCICGYINEIAMHRREALLEAAVLADRAGRDGPGHVCPDARGKGLCDHDYEGECIAAALRELAEKQ